VSSDDVCSLHYIFVFVTWEHYPINIRNFNPNSFVFDGWLMRHITIFLCSDSGSPENPNCEILNLLPSCRLLVFCSLHQKGNALMEYRELLREVKQLNLMKLQKVLTEWIVQRSGRPRNDSRQSRLWVAVIFTLAATKVRSQWRGARKHDCQQVICKHVRDTCATQRIHCYAVCHLLCRK
jgi:hypothetical protein